MAKLFFHILVPCLCLAFLIHESSGRDLDSNTNSNSNSPLSFSFESFERNSSFNREIGLYGDSEISNATVRITRPAISSSGRVVYRNPIRFLGRNPGFSTDFSFSLSSCNNRCGFAFFITMSSVRMDLVDPWKFGLPPSVVSVDFFTKRDPKVGNLCESYIGIDVGGDVAIKSSDLSSNGLVLNSKEKLHSWIDYNGTSNRLEVRLSESDKLSKPRNPFLSYRIDLSNVLWREKIVVGFSSSSENSTQNSTLYGWSFATNHGAPYMMHSQPLDPDTFLARPGESSPPHLKRNYPWGILLALIFAAACGAMVTFFSLFVWFSVFTNRPIAPVEYPVHPADVVYEKIVIVGVKDVKNGKK